MIRAAKPSDAESVAPLIIQAMGDLAKKFTNSDDLGIIIPVFEYFFRQQGNQYSFENTLVFQNESEVLGSINAYDGANLQELRKPFLAYLAKNYGLKDFNPEPETEAGEFYLDAISVNPIMQGKGIGKLLIQAGINWAAKLEHTKVGLLVEISNKGALKLYQNMGFQIQNEKPFIGGMYYHMVYEMNV